MKMSMYQLQTLYKPVDRRELALIKRLGWSRFPPRETENPIFYTDLSEEELAAGISNEHIIKLHVRKEYISRFVVVHKEHDELQVPADAIEDFNNNIIGLIELAR